MVWKIEDSDGNETGKVIWELPRYTRGRGLDVGCGPFKAFPHMIGVDNHSDTKLFGAWMKPDITANAHELGFFKDESMDCVYSSHLLEHLRDPAQALREWWRLIKVGGYLILYLPHRDFYPRIGQKGANPDHKHDFHPDDVIRLMEYFPAWDLLRNEDRNAGNEYSFFQVYQKLSLTQGDGHG